MKVVTLMHQIESHIGKRSKIFFLRHAKIGMRDTVVLQNNPASLVQKPSYGETALIVLGTKTRFDYDNAPINVLIGLDPVNSLGFAIITIRSHMCKKPRRCHRPQSIQT